MSLRWAPKGTPLCLWTRGWRRERCSSTESPSQASNLLLLTVGGTIICLTFALLETILWINIFFIFVLSVYHCGSDEGWSDLFYFTALNDSSSFSPRFALYGDMGNENPQSLARLQKETQLGMYDVILHIGKPLAARNMITSFTEKAVNSNHCHHFKRNICLLVYE